MKRFLAAVLSLGLISVTFPELTFAQQKCPPELVQAQAALTNTQQAVNQAQAARAKRAQAGAGSQEVQAPRGQEVQAPRGQEIQAPRAQEVQAPRVAKARELVRQADHACKTGDMTLSAQKAKEALELLK